MIIPLDTRLEITLLNPQDKPQAEILKHLVDMRLKEKKYYERINTILVECARECMGMIAETTRD